MNLVGKLTAISIQITGLAIATIVLPYGSRAQVQQVTQALSPEQINLRAKQITVRIDGSGMGSGVIIAQSNNTYQVLTNWHVVKNPGQYTVQTIDGRQHPVNYADIHQLSGLDLAIVTFSANHNYQVADIGNSAQLTEGQNVYFTGYPGELRQEDNRYYRFFPANLVGVLPQSTQNGYSLIYNGEAFPGMSGGPVLDKNALLIGIHGEANIHAVTGAVSNYGIPINSYKQAIANNTANDSLATVPQQPATDESNSPSENEFLPPEITVETNARNTELSSSGTENNSDSSSEQSTNTKNPTSSNPDTEQVETTQSENEKNESSDSTQSIEETNNESPDTNPSSANSEVEQVEVTPPVVERDESSETATSSPNSQPSDSVVPQTLPLISNKTGIDYTNLQNLLSNKKWREADLQTNYLINEIIKTAKRKHPHTFIELKSLTDFACNDIKTINQLWQKYSKGHFGFSPQQQIWFSVNKNGKFSPKTWRNFATLLGWKQGDISSGSGYLLYEQLTFDLQKAPAGHLPWWFASSQEQQNVIKHIFNRCDFDSVEPDEDRSNSRVEENRGDEDN